MKDVSNQYAAMPSLHVAWSLWCACVLVPRLRHGWAKALAVLYPVVTLLAVVVTANHYFLDAVGGAVVLAVGFLIGRGSPRSATAPPADAIWPRRRTATGGTACLVRRAGEPVALEQ